MAELKASREETTRIRQESGAADVRPGEVEGMREGDDSGTLASGPVRSRAMEKRKREIDERRQMLEAKRKKIRGSGPPDISTATSNDVLSHPRAEETSPAGSKLAPTIVQDSFSSPEAQSGKRQLGENAPTRVYFDPFSQLEKQSHVSKKTSGKTKAGPAPNEADSFLAQLEEEFLASKFGTQN